MKHQSAGPAYADRARAALLAHACGDRFGAPLEFVSAASVRTRTVVLGNWIEDTHMSFCLGEAILAHGPGPLRPDSFGQAVGEAFVRWLHDPLMPSTAPGGTCLSGARRFQRRCDWRGIGIKESDGCGAVMRVCPVALAFRSEDPAGGCAYLGPADPRPAQCPGSGHGRGLAVQPGPGDRVLGRRAGRGGHPGPGGALLGAALGEAAIPPDWLRTLPRRTEIADLADHLVAQAQRQQAEG